MTTHQPPRVARSPLAEFPVSDKCLGETPRFDDAPVWIYNHDNPYLHGVYAPTTRELNQDKLEVLGDLPHDLRGTYYRNGANPVFEPKNRYHPFDGDGMITAIRFDKGKPSLTNKFVQTKGFLEEKKVNKFIYRGVFGTQKSGGILNNALEFAMSKNTWKILVKSMLNFISDKFSKKIF